MKGGLAEKWKTCYVTGDMANQGTPPIMVPFTSTLDKPSLKQTRSRRQWMPKIISNKGRGQADEYTAEFVSSSLIQTSTLITLPSFLTRKG